jgi:hypothetical protein
MIPGKKNQTLRLVTTENLPLRLLVKSKIIPTTRSNFPPVEVKKQVNLEVNWTMNDTPTIQMDTETQTKLRHCCLPLESVPMNRTKRTPSIEAKVDIVAKVMALPGKDIRQALCRARVRHQVVLSAPRAM